MAIYARAYGRWRTCLTAMAVYARVYDWRRTCLMAMAVYARAYGRRRTCLTAMAVYARGYGSRRTCAGDGGLRARVRSATYLSDGDGGRVSRSGRDAVLLREGHFMLRVDDHPHARLLRQLAEVLVLLDVHDQLQRCNDTTAASKADHLLFDWLRNFAI